jgi:preprotein translocase, SecE subunit, bacterial
MKKILNFFKDTKKEMKKVKWPTKKEMVTYSSATLTFIVVFALFFGLTDLVLAFINSWVVK